MRPAPPSPIILASTSPYRRALMERLGLPFTWVAPDVDEDAAKALERDPVALAESLALAKARVVAGRHPQAIVIGSDQVVAMGRLILGKPGDRDAAAAQLCALSGRIHTLITAVAVVSGDRLRKHTDLTSLTMRPLGLEEITRYLDADAPFDCAGGYKLESLGITLFESIASADHSAITGLPLIALTTILRDLGVALP